MSRRRESSPGPGPSRISGAWSAAANSEPISLREFHGENPLSASHTQSHTLSWRERVHSGLHWRSPAQKTIQPKLDVDWDRTRLRVKEVLSTFAQVAGDVALPIAAEAMSVVPIPGLAPAAKILDSIWKSVQTVQTNRSSCLRVTERCADLLLAINEVMADSGDEVTQELQKPLERIERSFQGFSGFLKGQAELSFFTRYLKKDDILRQIQDHDKSIRDCMFLFHTAIQAKVLQHVLKPSTQKTELLMAPVETYAPASSHNEILDALDLAISVEPIDATTQDDVSSLSERLRQVQETENEADRARDIEDLGRVLHLALEAPSHLAVTRILQISKPDMPIAIMVLLRELERQQEKHKSPAGSPSPRIRSLTWPLDGIPARQVVLLHRQFMEFGLEALKKTTWDSGLAIPGSPSILSGNFQRVPGATEIQVYPPSEPDSYMSNNAGTAITTPLASDDGRMTFELESFSPGGSTANFDLALDPPSNPAEAAAEIRYRMSLSHAFHHLSVTLPLWTPSLVEVGAVGYLATPSGSFRTLFNATSGVGRPAGVPKLAGVSISRQKQNQTGTVAKGMRILDRLTSPSNIKGTYAISAVGETAHLIAEKAEYHYFHSLGEPKKWFRANAEAILDAFPNKCLREELFLVFGTLNAQDHARFVNHGGDEGVSLLSLR
ncbi:hypothetical protein C8F04DRAFT_1176409 [Mycena alexandri]|uniref:Uncharacterized protein n=1 Tax=Mycena alexandri TaxID=1745969 RepID=A0AAD6TE30_9AGAR|nr:hypothetical protein C8F04DRAFT_1176409 [Mycena alexandri]